MSRIPAPGQTLEAVTGEERRLRNGHRGALVWLTGLSAAGKTTLAAELERRLFDRGVQVCVLDGDDLRHGLNRDLGFTAADRRENVRRAGEVGRLLVKAGFVVVAAFISPYSADRDGVRARLEPGDFVEVWLKCHISVCEARDPKGHYRRARSGELAHFTGISDPYEPPAAPELTVETDRAGVAECADALLDQLKERGIIA